ncbi:MAG: YfhO family protein [Proteobacteria bacterium]|nr:YfhO family protein [Pseudomonadota bacterium]
MTSRFWRAHGIMLLGLVAIALIVYGELLWPGRVPYSPHSDVATHGLAIKEVLHQAVESNQFPPFWRSDQLSGGPALTQPQALYTYPLHLLFWFLPPLAAIGPTFWLHLLLAGIGCYTLGAALDLRASARLLMGVSGLVSFKLLLIVYAGWQPVIPILSLLPWLFGAVIFFCRAPGLPRGLWLAAAAAFCLNAGTPQYIHFAALILGSYLTIETVRKYNSKGIRQALIFVGWLLAAGLLACGLSAHVWLPIAADLPFLTRADHSYEFFLSGHALTPRHLLTALGPELLGSPLDREAPYLELWEDVLYFGLIPLGLALCGALGYRKNHFVRFFAIAFLATGLLAFDTPVLEAAYQLVPGYNFFRCPSRILFLTLYIVIALSGFGAERVLDWVSGQTTKTWLPLIVLCIALLAMVVEARVYAAAYIRMVDYDYLVPELPFGKDLDADDKPFRIATLNRSTLNYGWAASNRLQLVSGYDPYNFTHYRRYFDLMQTGQPQAARLGNWFDLRAVQRPDMLDALNVRYLLSPQPLSAKMTQFTLKSITRDAPAFQFYRGMISKDIWLYENNRFLERAFWVDAVVKAPDESAAAEAMIKLDLRRIAVVTAPSLTTSAPAKSKGRVQVMRSRPGELVLNLKNSARRFLVISEIWHPGWKATLDRKPLSLTRTDLALIGAWIPPGTHNLYLSFTPPGWTTGLVLTAISLLVFLLLVVLVRLRWSV